MKARFQIEPHGEGWLLVAYQGEEEMWRGYFPVDEYQEALEAGQLWLDSEEWLQEQQREEPCHSERSFAEAKRSEESPVNAALLELLAIMRDYLQTQVRIEQQLMSLTSYLRAWDGLYSAARFNPRPPRGGRQKRGPVGVQGPRRTKTTQGGYHERTEKKSDKNALHDAGHVVSLARNRSAGSCRMARSAVGSHGSLRRRVLGIAGPAGRDDWRG